MESIEAFILAGGASSRMGSDKFQLPLQGQTVAQLIAYALHDVASSVTVVGRQLDDPSLNCKPDVYPQWGALGGVHAALSGCMTEWAIIVACDMPWVSGDLFKRLGSLREQFDAVVPVQADGRPQPLCGFYRVGPCLTAAERLIKDGERRPLTLLQSVRTRWVPFEELNDLPEAEFLFANLNTPDDYARALMKGESLHTKD